MRKEREGGKREGIRQIVREMFVFSLGDRIGGIGIWRFEDSSKGEKWEEEGNFRGRWGKGGVGTLG